MPRDQRRSRTTREEEGSGMPKGFSAGDTAWLLVSAALVLLMVPV
jgi:hypothetical protein